MVAGAVPGNPLEGEGASTDPALAACEENGSNVAGGGVVTGGGVPKVVAGGGCKMYPLVEG